MGGIIVTAPRPLSIQFVSGWTSPFFLFTSLIVRLTPDFQASFLARFARLCNSRLSSFNFVQDSWTWLQVHLLAPYHIVWPVPGVSPLLDAGAALL
ncbi:hypothetical protein Y032_0030g2090 [Ancylostoma ceylanicum]|uniref:Uncharacterized protein n=1 Tax=Ancylostoma ceylanicum TaxID=53326 RepID=A0A016UQP4_9BILA|nr:hypothetical protein Y032_0030g2090 [Ancylostoma ceylanicum]